MLFAVTPLLLADDDLASITTSVIHGEQTFTWHRPIPIDEEVAVTGEITKMRERGGVFFVGFDLSVSDGETELISGSSLFLMSGGAATTGDVVEEAEPHPLSGSDLETAERAPRLDDGDPISALGRSASRADLVRYAGASQDFNPIHWDHEVAVGAGLPGVVVHGLMQSAWLCQAVERHGALLEKARFRFRAPLRPARATRIEGARKGEGWEVRIVGVDGTEHVLATFSDRA
jgi:acyl dehydratase